MSDLDLNTTEFFAEKEPRLLAEPKGSGCGCRRRPEATSWRCLRASTDVAHDKFKEAADAAKDVASGAADRFQDQARKNSAGVRISWTGSLVTSGMPPGLSRATHLLLPGALILRPNMSTRPPKRSAMEASATSSTAPPISRNASPLHSLGSRCSPALRRSVF